MPDEPTGEAENSAVGVAVCRALHVEVDARPRYSKMKEDLVVEQAAQDVTQCVIPGAGLDTFAKRQPEIASRLSVLEVDQPRPLGVEAPT